MSSATPAPADDATGAAAHKADAPSPDDPRKPGSPTDLHKPSWLYVLRTTVREFLGDQCTDLAAALTYYAVLAIAPALLAVVSRASSTWRPTSVRASRSKGCVRCWSA